MAVASFWPLALIAGSGMCIFGSGDVFGPGWLTQEQVAAWELQSQAYANFRTGNWQAELERQQTITQVRTDISESVYAISNSQSEINVAPVSIYQTNRRGPKALIYEHNPKHLIGVSVGNIAAAPTPDRGQAVLNWSVPLGGNSLGRIGADPLENTVIVFRQHRQTEIARYFHGYIIPWDDMSDKWKRILRDAELVDGRKGNIRAWPTLP